jgi:cobalt-zinc-cadmium efflux system outer membrane protein
MKSAAILSSILTMLFAVSGLAHEPATTLTLQRVIDLYLAKNLELQAARYRVERFEADQIVARLRPNPSVLVTAENLPLSGPTPFGRLYEVGVSYAETFELGAKRNLRAKVAEATVSVAEAQLEDAIRRGIAEVKRLYLDALRSRYDLSVAIENQQTFDQLIQVNLARFQAGRIPEADLIKVRLERVKFDAAVKQAELELRQATIQILNRLGESTFAAEDISGELDTLLMPFDLMVLREMAIQERADLQIAERELEAAKQRLALEQARAKPDLMPFVGYKRIASDNTVMGGVSIPLKTRDHNQGGIARAMADQRIAEAQLEIVRNRALAEVELAYAAVQTAREQVQTFRNELLNQAEESRSIALAAYQEGATALLPVLEAQRTRAEVRRQYFQTLFNYQVSLVDLELAVGRDLRP